MRGKDSLAKTVIVGAVIYFVLTRPKSNQVSPTTEAEPQKATVVSKPSGAKKVEPASPKAEPFKNVGKAPRFLSGAALEAWNELAKTLGTAPLTLTKTDGENLEALDALLTDEEYQEAINALGLTTLEANQIKFLAKAF